MFDFGPILTQTLESANSLLQIFGLSLNWGHLTWGVIQLGIAILCFVGARIAAKRVEPKLEAKVRDMQFAPNRLRLVAVLLRRTHLFFFVFALWFAVSALRALTWDSRSFFLFSIANLASAWLIISIVSRIIKNRTLARAVAILGWFIASLQILGVLSASVELADQLAIQLGEFRLSALLVFQGILLLSFLFWAAFFLSRLVEKQFQSLEDVSPTMRVLVGKLSRFLLLTLASIIGLSMLGIDFTALTLVSGAIGLGIGFGLQKVVSNLISGVILLLDRSIKPGDVISVGNTFGWITSLSARYASVTARDGREYLIPNEDLITQRVENWSFNDPYIRIEILFGVSYNADPHKVKELAVKAALAQPRTIRTTGEYQTVCHVVAFGESSIDFTLRFWISDPTNGITNIRGDVFLALWDTFKEHDIEIPYPHRHLLLDKSAAGVLHPDAPNGTAK